MSSRNAPADPAPGSSRPAQWSIVRRLTVLYTATTAVLLVAAAAYLYWTQVQNLEREDNDFLVNKIQDCRRLLREHPDQVRQLINEVQIESVTSPIKYYIRILDLKGRTVLETPGMAARLPASVFPAAASATTVPRRGTLHRTGAGQVCLMMAGDAGARLAGADEVSFQVALDVSEEEELIEGYRWKLLAVILSGTVFSSVAGYFVARRGLAPLQEIAQVTERITASQLHERIESTGWPVELASLARSFDRMLDRLGDSFNRLSQFSADLAHELRTPINNLCGEAGVALSQSRTPDEYRSTLESSLEEFARLTRLIDNLLFLARADSPTATAACEQFKARAAVDSVCEFYEALAEDRGVSLRCVGEAAVSADPVLFRQAASNLISNALNHTPRGGQVLVTVQAGAEGGCDVEVADTGCGIEARHLPYLFDRLYRVEPARSQNPDGAGLGLAIVKSIMTLHGGTVRVESEPGRGAKFTLQFPRNPGKEVQS